MLVELSGPVVLGAIGLGIANVVAVVRVWHRIDLRLTLLEANMRAALMDQRR